jgi:hypothetical protein
MTSLHKRTKFSVVDRDARIIARAKTRNARKRTGNFFEKNSKKPLTIMRDGSTNTLVSCKLSTLQTRHCGLKGGILDAR